MDSHLVADGKRPVRMISVADACDRLGESRSHFYRYTLRHLRFYKTGRAMRIDEKSIDELIEARLAGNPANPRRGRPRKVRSAEQSTVATA
jgi:excisionase family DNA binding protein